MPLQVGYVEQFGVHSASATVLESLHFSAALRLPASVTSPQRDALINETIELLELAPIAEKLVGSIATAEGLSFEEIKRLTIAVEVCVAATRLPQPHRAALHGAPSA